MPGPDFVDTGATSAWSDAVEDERKVELSDEQMIMAASQIAAGLVSAPSIGSDQAMKIALQTVSRVCKVGIEAFCESESS